MCCCLLTDHEFCEYVSFSVYIHGVWHRADTHLLNVIWPNSSSCLTVMTEEDKLNWSHAGWFPHHLHLSQQPLRVQGWASLQRRRQNTWPRTWLWLHSKEWTRAQDSVKRSLCSGIKLFLKSGSLALPGRHFSRPARSMLGLVAVGR